VLRPRLIPCLLIHKGGLVKTVQFGSPKYVGDPLNAVRIFNEKQVDELMVVDIDCSRHGSAPNEKLIAELAAECRMPLCYGGGIKSVEQVERLIALGVEKVVPLRLKCQI
jgi:imidazole glycerol-phosphate synthase subunit HisF